MSKHSIYTWAKNRDLHATSAFEALTHELGFTYLKTLYRFDKTTLELAHPEKLEDALTQCFDLVNLNNAYYQLDSLPSFIPSEAVIASVAPKSEQHHESLIAKLNTFFGLGITHLHKETVWVFDVTGDISAEQLRSDLITTTSPKQGLLANPIYESVTLVGH